MFIIIKRNGEPLEKPFPREIATYPTKQSAENAARLVPGSKIARA